MTVTVDPITLQLALQRLEFETGLDVNAIIDERDRLKEQLDGSSGADAHLYCLGCTAFHVEGPCS